MKTEKRIEVEFLVDQSTGFGEFKAGDKPELRESIAKILEQRSIVKIPKKKVKDAQ